MEGQPQSPASSGHVSSNSDGNEKERGPHGFIRIPSLGLGDSKKAPSKQGGPHDEPLGDGEAQEVLVKAGYPLDIITLLQQMNVLAFKHQRIEYESQIARLKADYEAMKQRLTSDYNSVVQSRDHEKRANQQLRDMLNERARDAHADMSKAVAEHAQQRRELEEKVFELAGGIEYASEGAMKLSLESVVSKIGSQVPNMFREADQANLEHRRIFVHLELKGRFNVLRYLDEYGSDVWFHICNMLVFDSIWREIDRKFCIGADEALEAIRRAKLPVASVEQVLRMVEHIGLGQGEEGKACQSDSVVSHRSATYVKIGKRKLTLQWRAQTTRLLLLLADVDLSKASESPESREKVFKKAPSLKLAVDGITQKAIAHFSEFTLRRDLDGPENQSRIYRTIFPWASDLTFLWLNTRLSGKEYVFRRFEEGDELNRELMKVVFSKTNHDAEESKKRTSMFQGKAEQRVALAISPAFIKPGGVCLYPAEVITRTVNAKSSTFKGIFGS
ncbi:MAG: hypothetical protein M1839_002998 [Geoglossum umbratile]|nr:MAG: hypothetical protein M1839_002998 [Geoglossum umbratile]